jgi:hypothetical protein
MDVVCMCGHPTQDHHFEDDAPGICNWWIEEKGAWCPCIAFVGTTGSNAGTVEVRLVVES